MRTPTQISNGQSEKKKQGGGPRVAASGRNLSALKIPVRDYLSWFGGAGCSSNPSNRRTDARCLGDDWPFKPNLPLIPGHEAVGIVESVGNGVKEVKEGDRVAIPWMGYACGSCRLGVSGWETRCEQQVMTGYLVDGGYAEYAKANAKFVGKVPNGVDPLAAAPLRCAGVTTYKAVKVSGAGSSELVAVFGVGGLRHLAAPFSHAKLTTLILGESHNLAILASGESS